MDLSKLTSNIKLSDSSLLTLTGIFSGLGSLISFFPIMTWYWLALFVVYEVFYLLWVIFHFKNIEKRNVLIVVALKIQVQSVMRSFHYFLYIFILLAITLPFFYYFQDELGSQKDIEKIIFYASKYNLLIPFGLVKMTLVLSIFISFYRFFILSKSGFKLNKLFNGSFNVEIISIPAPVGEVNKNIIQYFYKLRNFKSPQYSFLGSENGSFIFGSKLIGKDTYELKWPFYSSLLRVSLVSTGAITTDIHLSFELRGGIYRLELTPNPVEVQMLMRFLQTHVFQPLKGEFISLNSVRKQNELRNQAIASQLRILQSQIEPHFLFNTLANVRYRYRTSVEVGEEMMDSLIIYLRSAMESLRSEVSTVEKEMNLLLHYLVIMEMRMGEQFSYEFIIPDSLKHQNFPPAMLISLVENSIKHGLHSKKNGKVTISAMTKGNQLRVTVADNGAGFSSVEGTGVGLSNISQRLESLYGNRACLDVNSVSEGGFMASILIPLEGYK